MQEQQVAEQIRDGVQRLVDGKMDRSEFKKFLEAYNKILDDLKAAKDVEENCWWH